VVEGKGGADEVLQASLVDRVPFGKVDGPPRAASEPGVEYVLRVREHRPLGKGYFDDFLVGVGQAEYSAGAPGRRPHPFPLFSDIRNRLVNDAADGGEHLAAPVPQALDLPVDQF
jgi:hypothetical protein